MHQGCLPSHSLRKQAKQPAFCRRFTEALRGNWENESLSNLPPSLSAYKEKMKELSMLSLICSCFYPEPRNISIYTYDGESPAAETSSCTTGRESEHMCCSPGAPNIIRWAFYRSRRWIAVSSQYVLLIAYCSQQFEAGANNGTLMFLRKHGWLATSILISTSQSTRSLFK